jgi:Putative adhesin
MRVSQSVSAATLLSALLTLPAGAQMRDNQEKTLTCDNQGSHVRRLASYCEMKEQVLPAGQGVMKIDPGQNGGVAVKGWNRPDVLIRARIEAVAPSDSEARSMVPQVRFSSGASQISADGPAQDRDHSWSVSYEIFAPHQSDIDATAVNGGIHIQDVRGHVQFKASNGGVTLARLAGEVHGQTTNGGLHVELEGDHWDGKGMDVETVNGGVKMSVPANYSAHLETATTNGAINVDFPVTMQGKMTKAMSFNIGNGGATVRVITTNGGVKIQRS